MKLTQDDCTEIYYAIDAEQALQVAIGVDGETLAAGQLELTATMAAAMVSAVKAKRERIESGVYDDYQGECSRPRSCTGKWIAHLARIEAKLARVAA